MRFLVDESTGPSVSKWLKEQVHDVFCVYQDVRGISDDQVIFKAFTEERILITNDKDFGEKIFRYRESHKGVILLRLDDECSSNKIALLRKLIGEYPDRLNNHFIVVTETQIRISTI
jgi:predicted nuclease of predicted toxin-antitoxin system